MALLVNADSAVSRLAKARLAIGRKLGVQTVERPIGRSMEKKLFDK
jgi:hypothetical protein